MEQKSTPLILVFYLDRTLMTNKNIIEPYVNSVNEMLHAKEANALAFFLPTDGEEFIDCINPTIIDEADMKRINQMIADIRKNFSVGDGEVKTPDIELTPEQKKQD
jgi:hypothetical protein